MQDSSLVSFPAFFWNSPCFNIVVNKNNKYCGFGLITSRELFQSSFWSMQKGKKWVFFIPLFLYCIKPKYIMLQFLNLQKISCMGFHRIMWSTFQAMLFSHLKEMSKLVKTYTLPSTFWLPVVDGLWFLICQVGHRSQIIAILKVQRYAIWVSRTPVGLNCFIIIKN